MTMSDKVDCTAAMRQLWDYLDEELNTERMGKVREHLESCQRCWPHHDFERAFLDALARTRSERLMPDELRRRVLASLEGEGYTRS